MSATALAEDTRSAAIDELLRAGTELDELMHRNPSVFYTPSPAQLRVIREIERIYANDPAALQKVITLFWLGGNGNGKTRLLAEIAVNLMEGPQSPWFETPFFQNFPRPCHGRMTSTNKALQEGMIREIRAALVEHLAPGYPLKNGYPFESLWMTRCGSTLELLTWDMGVTTHAGAKKDFILKDEPGPMAVSDEDDARLRAGGPVFHFLSPVDESGFSPNVAWIIDRIEQSEEGKFPGLHVIYTDAEDNCVEHACERVEFSDGSVRYARGRVPHTTIQDNYNRWKAISPATLQARFFGKHVRELGKVLRNWDVNLHVVADARLIPAPHWQRIFALDTHPSKPEVGIYLYVTPFGELIVKREIVLEKGPDGLIVNMATLCKELFRTWGQPDVLLIDPLAATPNPVNGGSVLKEYRKHGIPFLTAGAEKADKTLAIDRLIELLKGTPDGFNADGEPRFRPLLKVSDACPFTISQAKRWMRDKNGHPGKEHDDSWECIYRAALNVPLGGKATKRQVAAKLRPRSPLVMPRR